MIIGGLEKLSLIDYPGELAAVVFTQGCNFRCPFCHNPMLVQASSEAGKVKNNSQNPEVQEGHPYIAKDDLLDFLKTRAGRLDGVVVTGGEPTVHPDLDEFLNQIKDLGYKIKLDTNGTNPEVLEKMIQQGQVDYLAMDFKGSPERYSDITRTEVDFSNIQKSAILIMNSGLSYEFRTTVIPGLVTKSDIEKIGDNIQGAEKWFLQRFINHTPLLSEDFQNRQPFSDKEMEEMKRVAQHYVANADIR